jgi:hypothetical protein
MAILVTSDLASAGYYLDDIYIPCGRMQGFG